MIRTRGPIDPLWVANLVAWILVIAYFAAGRTR